MKNLLARLRSAYGQNAMLCKAAADEIVTLRQRPSPGVLRKALTDLGIDEDDADELIESVYK